MNSLDLQEIVHNCLKTTGLAARQASIQAVGHDGLIRDIKKGRMPSFDRVVKLLNVLGMQVEITPASGVAQEYIMEYFRPNFTSAGTFDKSEYTLVPRLDVKALIAYRAAVEHEHKTSFLAFRYDWLRKCRLQPDKISVIEVSGDSMSPILNDGDVVMLDHNRCLPRVGKIFAVLTNNDELVVKFLVQMTDDGGHRRYVLVSNHPEDEPRLLGENDTLIGEVVWRGTLM